MNSPRGSRARRPSPSEAWPASPEGCPRRRRVSSLRGRLAGAETRPTRGDLDDVAVGVSQVDGAEGAAVEHVGAVQAAAAQVIPPRLLLGGRLDAQREVV